jgi:hypothetical protein
MSKMTPAERRLRAQIAAHSRWAKEDDRRAATQAMRDGLQARFEHQVDPDGTLDPTERARRAANARSEYFKRLALKSATARRRKREAGNTAA